MEVVKVEADVIACQSFDRNREKNLHRGRSKIKRLKMILKRPDLANGLIEGR